jgi:uncharacterized protein
MFSNFQGEATSDDKLWSALTYALSPIVPIIVFLMADKKNRPFIKSHNAQALILGILEVIIGSITIGCGALIIWIFMLVLAYQAYQGKQIVLPLITDFCKNQGWA